MATKVVVTTKLSVLGELSLTAFQFVCLLLIAGGCSKLMQWVAGVEPSSLGVLTVVLALIVCNHNVRIGRVGL